MTHYDTLYLNKQKQKRNFKYLDNKQARTQNFNKRRTQHADNMGLQHGKRKGITCKRSRLIQITLIMILIVKGEDSVQSRNFLYERITKTPIDINGVQKQIRLTWT